MACILRLPSIAVVKTLPADRIGVPWLPPGGAVFQRRFPVGENFSGRSFASLAPLYAGPRQLAQSVAAAAPAGPASAARAWGAGVCTDRARASSGNAVRNAVRRLR